ncbi:protein NETWORKED 2A [Benincasa hispida]|uniref:protein NETWORKED 2A n=1 Tax=Benincasa hispida TaxID=102211 RepID=UPI0019027173|nr:protein NETWORKED 2A [Benincasa hispida]
MLQRAASNAYSWWWASHIRTKQSKWLEQNLHDMEEKVDNMMRIIEGDGDSFAKRAEMYYRKRPELVEHVEESFRAYRALAERYDHLSKEFQGANRTIASIFPERVHYTIDDDDCEVDFFPTKSPHEFSSELDGSPKLGIPEVPKFPERGFRSPSMIRKKAQLKRNASTPTSRAALTPKSGLSKTEALEEIDMLQKEILARQTEMEFVKSLYERECEKYWDMENSITKMQKRVSNLQDEFGIGTIIEDNEARTIMAATALNSCRETLTKLQEEQEKTVEETRLENDRIKKVDKKFESLKCKFLPNPTDNHESTDFHEDQGIEPGLKISDQLVACTAEDKHDIELLDQKIREHLEMDSNSSFTISELAEKIDELVNKIVTLEAAVSSQTSLVRRLKSETDMLQANVQQLEEDKEILVESSENMKKKIKELEAELARVKNLNQNAQSQNNTLQTQFIEASTNLDHLSDQLQTMKMDDVETCDFSRDVMMVDPDVKTSTFSTNSEFDGRKVGTLKLGDFFIDEEQKESIPGNNKNLGLAVEKVIESGHELNDERPQLQTENTLLDLEANESQEEEKHPTLRQLFLKGIEDREKILLEEYTSVLRDYKDVRNKLSEVEQKNRDSIFELAMQVKELKDAISSKDDVIKSLVNNGETDEDTNARDVDQELPQESIHEAPSYLYSESSTPYIDQVSIFDSYGERGIEPTEESYKSMRNSRSLAKKEDVNKKSIGGDKFITMSPTEERFRSHIDGQLEMNLEFWLRFSTAVHQIQKFQTSIHDLQSELQKLRENKQQEGSVKHQQAMESDARPIYTHLREIQTELSLWLEHSAVLKDELCNRFSSLCDIQSEISRIIDEGSDEEKTELSDYQAAKFQGEVLNMKQENRKIADELQVGQGRVRVLQVQIEKALEKLDQEFGISAGKSIQQSKSLSRTRIPLRSFLFGVKLKRQKPSLFSCASPQLQKQYSDLAKGPLPQ